MKFSTEQLNDKLASNPALRRRNPSLTSTASSSKPEQVILNGVQGAIPRTLRDGSRYAVRIVSHRVRLIDPDNLCAKAFVDCLRHAGLLPDDTAAIMDYSVQQQKAKSKKEQFTEIVIERLP